MKARSITIHFYEDLESDVTLLPLIQLVQLQRVDLDISFRYGDGTS